MSIAGALDQLNPRQRLERMLPALCDVSRPKTWRLGEIALAAVDPASAVFPDSPAAVAVLFDGSIHNTSELRRDLADQHCVNADALLSAGYSRWGTGIFDRLVGEYACAIWDGREQRLILARDPAASHPLFYALNRTTILFASTARSLQTDPEISRELDLVHIARRAVWYPENEPDTYFSGIKRVVPGHVAIFERGQHHQERWWYPERIPTLRLRKNSEYAEALLDVLETAVASRLPDAGPVGVTMSSGLDSTSVAAVAARRLRTQGRSLTAFTFVPSEHLPDEPGQVQHEAARASLITTLHDNIDHVVVADDAEHDIIAALDERNRYADFPVLAGVLAGPWEHFFSAVAKTNCKHVLGGDIGNFTISYHGLPHLSGLVRHGQFWKWAKLQAGLRRHIGWRGSLQHSFGPLLPPRIRKGITRAFGGWLPEAEEWSPLRAEFAVETGAFEYAAENMLYRVGDSRAFRIRLIQRTDQGLPRNHFFRRFGLSYTDPTADRRVIELCLSIPEEQFILNGEPRSLIRRAMRGIVPDEILDAKSQGIVGGGWQLLMTRARPQILEELQRIEGSRLAQHCLNLPRLRMLAENWPTTWGRTDRNTYLNYLSRGLALGHFLRKMEGSN